MASLEELIQQGWAEHAGATDVVAKRLEESVALVTGPSQAGAFLGLANHAIGDHLGDRKRALALCEQVVRRLGEEPGADALLQLAVAHRLAGDAGGAKQAFERSGLDESGQVRLDMLVAQGRMHAGDWPGAAGTYAEALSLSESLPEGHAGERATAIVSNNIASEALELPQRNATQDTLMERAAEAARTFWLRIGTWMNDMRADYLLACVQTSLGRPGKGRTYAERGLATLASHGEAPVDEAFLHVARARACRDLGQHEVQAESIAHAETLAEGFDDAGLRDWFAGELSKAR